MSCLSPLLAIQSVPMVSTPYLPHPQELTESTVPTEDPPCILPGPLGNGRNGNAWQGQYQSVCALSSLAVFLSLAEVAAGPCHFLFAFLYDYSPSSCTPKLPSTFVSDLDHCDCLAHLPCNSFQLCIDYSRYSYDIYTQLLQSSPLSMIPGCSKNGHWGVSYCAFRGIVQWFVADIQICTHFSCCSCGRVLYKVWVKGHTCLSMR